MVREFGSYRTTSTLEEVAGSAQPRIKDHGVGIPPEESEWIFEKFNQRDVHSPGVGLGLFISRGLARAHGGDITVDSSPDVGTEFTLTLPTGARPTTN